MSSCPHGSGPRPLFPRGTIRRIELEDTASAFPRRKPTVRKIKLGCYENDFRSHECNSVKGSSKTTSCGAWWLSGKCAALRPESRRLESQSTQSALEFFPIH